MEFSIAVLKPGFKKEYVELLENEIKIEELNVFYKFYKQFTEKEIENFFSTSLNLSSYRKYMTSAPSMVFLVGGKLCSYKLRKIKKKIRKIYNVDSTMINNIIHSSDDGVEFYLQSMLCKKELDSLNIVLNGFANMCIYASQEEKISSDINALIFSDRQLCDRNYLGQFDYVGFESFVKYQGRDIKIINYYNSNESISAVYFENDLVNCIDCLKYLDSINVQGILLYNKQVDLTIAEEVEDYLELNLPHWFIIGGDGVTIGEYNYNKFLNMIKSNPSTLR